MVNKGNHPQMALFQVSELLWFTQIYIYIINSVWIPITGWMTIKPQKPCADHGTEKVVVSNMFILNSQSSRWSQLSHNLSKGLEPRTNILIIVYMKYLQIEMGYIQVADPFGRWGPQNFSRSISSKVFQCTSFTRLCRVPCGQIGAGTLDWTSWTCWYGYITFLWCYMTGHESLWTGYMINNYHWI
jgi:hypothetical protein